MIRIKELSIKQNMFWNSAGSITYLGCQWLITILVVRISSDYVSAGMFSLAASVYGIFSPIAQYRMYTYQISDVKNENTVGEYLMFRFVTCLIALSICMGYSFVTCSPDAYLPIFLYGVYKSATLVIDVFHASDQRHSRMDYIGRSLMLQGAVSLVLFALVFYFSQNLSLTLLAMTLGIVAICFAYDCPRTNRLEHVVPSITLKKTKRLLYVCLPLVLAGIVCSAAPALPRQYLFNMFGDSALGVYASVAAPIAIIQMGASYIYNPLLGYFAQYFEDGQWKRFSDLMIKATLGIFAVAIVGALLLQFFGVQILCLMFGESIAEYSYLLQPLIISAFATGYMWFINDLLIAVRDFKATVIGSVVAFLVSVGTMIPLIDLFNMNGVTFVLILSNVISFVVMAVMLGIHIEKARRNEKR